MDDNVVAYNRWSYIDRDNRIHSGCVFVPNSYDGRDRSRWKTIAH